MGAFAVPLPRRPDSLIGYAGAGRRGRDPSSQKGLGGAPEGGRLPSNGAVARRVPGLGSTRSGEAAAHPPRAQARSNPGPRALQRGSRRPPRAEPWENGASAVGASALLADQWRGAAPPPQPVFVPGAGGHCVRARNGGLGSPPPPCPRPLGNSKTTSGVRGGSPAFSLPERPGDGLSAIRSQIPGRFPFPASLLETLRFTEKSLQGFGSLTQGWYLNRKKGRRGESRSPYRWESSPGSQ